MIDLKVVLEKEKKKKEMGIKPRARVNVSLM